jgi:hypothetical protein
MGGSPEASVAVAIWDRLNKLDIPVVMNCERVGEWTAIDMQPFRYEPNDQESIWLTWQMEDEATVAAMVVLSAQDTQLWLRSGP